ncbi:MAG: hypothetical protein J5J00_13555 [Deltaproteobacteria bacterium]|nr:hypothetical protein [Deltaproteobacteria bacterium]
MYIFVAITVVISAAIIVGVLLYYRATLKGSAASEIQEKVQLVTEVSSQIDSLIGSVDKYGSKAQLEFLEGKVGEDERGLQKEKDQLKELESKLDSVQKIVEQKEAQHQEMKSAKEEDETKLAELLANYEQITQESIALEQKLASSLKSLDELVEGVQMTQEQRSVFEELSNTLTTASSRMRDLLTEYNMVKERLEALNMQHKDLEEEYTRLVEKQLGE